MTDQNNNEGGTGWQSGLSPGRTGAIFASLLLILFFASLDQTIVSTALPQISADLHGLSHYAWVATAYMLTSTVSVPIYGKLSDLFGRKIVLLFGITLFLIGSLCCAWAGSMDMLIAARALQGLGAGALIPVAFATMGHLYSPREIGKYQAFIAIAFVLASVVGPPIGGLLTDTIGWRWAFYINLPIGIITAGLLIWLMPRFDSQSVRKIDYFGALLLVVALTLILVGVDGTALAGSINSSWVIIAAAVISGGFIAWEFRTEHPILNPRLFSDSVVAVSSIFSAFTGAVMLATTFYLPAFLQVVLGYSAAGSGYLALPFSVAMGITATLSGYHASKSGKYRWNAIIGAALMSCGLGLIWWFLGAAATAMQMVIATTVLGLGLGVCVSLYGTIVRNVVAMNAMGEAQAGLTLCRQLGSTTGMAIIGATITAQLAGVTLSSLVHRAGMPVQVDPAIQAGMITGLHHAYAWLFALSIAAVVLLIVALKEVPLRTTHGDPEH